MSEYISIRDELYKKLDNMRIEKEGKKTSFSDSIQELLDENKLLKKENQELLGTDKFLKEESIKLKEDNQMLRTIVGNTKPTKEMIATENYTKGNIRLQSESVV